tara:strand:+ start:910 stop:1716 length:807 start_codon:yes stop_codon:yes gene_type:complete
MQKKPLVSILIASYNKEKYVTRCINSCLSQTYNNIEIIFVDDGSTDSSYEKAKKYKKIKTIKNYTKKKKNQFNTFFQINSYLQAFNKSKGKIITFLDADDFFKKNKIKQVVNYFEQNKKSNILFDRPIIFFSKNKFFYNNDYNNESRKSLWPKFPPQSCISIRRSFFIKNLKEIKNKNFPLLTLDFRLATISKVIFKDFKIIKKHLTFYFQDEKGESQSKFKKFSKNWWLRRREAHEYMVYLFKKNKIQYKNFDYTLTKIINFFYFKL